MNDLLNFYSLVFIFKLSRCNKVELYVSFPAAFTDFFVSINDNVQLYFQIYFIFIFTISYNSFPSIHNISSSALVFIKRYKQVRCC